LASSTNAGVISEGLRRQSEEKGRIDVKTAKRALVSCCFALALYAATDLAVAKELESRDITLGVGGKSLLYYLPLTIAEQRGYFKEEGLNITINDFAGGSQALQALIGGSVEVVTGGYEHTLNMQVKGQDIRAVIELARNATVLAVRKSKAGVIKSIADLRGTKIGVTAPGSSTYFFVVYLLSKAGLKPADVSFVGVGGGAGAVAGMVTGELDALSNLDPVISRLESDGAAVALADSRTAKGTEEIFGGPVPAAVLYARKEFIDANPETMQRLVNAFLKSLKWIAAATPEQIVDSVPKAMWLSDRQLFARSIAASQPTYSRSGEISEAGMAASLNVMRFDPAIAAAKIDLTKTYDGRFVKKALE
jgi:NitT/TauT family transport system substrate-binding protein